MPAFHLCRPANGPRMYRQQQAAIPIVANCAWGSSSLQIANQAPKLGCSNPSAQVRRPMLAHSAPTILGRTIGIELVSVVEDSLFQILAFKIYYLTTPQLTI